MDEKIIIVEDTMIKCPLLKREIANCYCYEINSFIGDLMQPSLEMLKDNIDEEAARKICYHCELNQIISPETRTQLKKGKDVKKDGGQK